jgi:hypothetical protein
MELVAFWFGIAVVTGIVGSSKGRSGFGWFVLGGLFSILALIVVLVQPSLKAVAGAPTPETHVRCPDCRELVYKDARKCKHCGTGLIAST